MKLSKIEALIAGAVLTVAQAVQLNITMSAQAHAALTVAITLIVAVGISPATPTVIKANLPVHLVAVIGAAVGGLLTLEQSFSIGPFWHTLISVVAVSGTAMGLGPAKITSTPAAIVDRRKVAVPVPMSPMPSPVPPVQK